MVCKNCTPSNLNGVSLHTYTGKFEVWCLDEGNQSICLLWVILHGCCNIEFVKGDLAVLSSIMLVRLSGCCARRFKDQHEAFGNGLKVLRKR